jgi:hypothetical protein
MLKGLEHMQQEHFALSFLGIVVLAASAVMIILFVIRMK